MSAMISLMILPVELIFQILFHLSPLHLTRQLFLNKLFVNIIRKDEEFHKLYLDHYFINNYTKNTTSNKLSEDLLQIVSTDDDTELSEKQQWSSSFTQVFELLMNVYAKRKYLDETQEKKRECFSDDFNQRGRELTTKLFTNNLKTSLDSMINRLLHEKAYHQSEECLSNKLVLLHSGRRIPFYCTGFSTRNKLFINNYEEGEAKEILSNSLNGTLFLENGYPLKIRSYCWDEKYSGSLEISVNNKSFIYLLRSEGEGWTYEECNEFIMSKLERTLFSKLRFELKSDDEKDILIWNQLDVKKLKRTIIFEWFITMSQSILYRDDDEHSIVYTVFPDLKPTY